MIWSKHPPSFKSVFPSENKDEEMDDEAMLNVVKMLNAALGGTVE